MTSGISTPAIARGVHEPRASSRPTLWLLAVFVLSRVGYWLAGVRFDARPLATFFQVLDLDLLRHRLLESIFYLHVQPPAFDVLIGVLLKLFPDSYALALHVLYAAMMLGTGFLLFRLMLALNVAENLALGLAALYLASPGVVLYENFALYEVPIAFLLTASAYLLFRYFRALEMHTPDRQAWANALLWTLFLLLMLRNHFHLLYFVLVFGILIWASPGARRPLFLAGLLPLVLIFGLFFKNWLLFGQFASSTWLGMNASVVTLHNLTPEEGEDLVRRGLISPMSLIPAGAPLGPYKPYIVWPQPTGIPALDEEVTSTNSVNFNHKAIIQIQKAYMRDSLVTLREVPRAYGRSLLYAWFAYFLPPSDFPFFDLNRPKIAVLDRLVNLVFFGQFKDASNRKELRALHAQGESLSLVLYTGTFLLIGLPALFLFGVGNLWKEIREKRAPRARLALLLFVLFNILYLTLVSNLLSSFETNRYRFPIDGFFLILLGMALEAIWRGARSRKVLREQQVPE
jgi:hypothetical protein